ncbi:hypothetical protein EN842_55840, partial [bacterium M00.F.Ca.ET.199.01.1.1]
IVAGCNRAQQGATDHHQQGQQQHPVASEPVHGGSLRRAGGRQTLLMGIGVLLGGRRLALGRRLRFDLPTLAGMALGFGPRRRYATASRAVRAGR